MSERSLSPTDYYELKHVKSIKVNQTSIKKNRSIHQKSNLELQLELNRQTRYQKKQRILKKLKAIGNAIIFIYLYKMEAIKKWKKKMHHLKLSKNLTILRRPAVLQSVNQLPNAQSIKQLMKYIISFERLKQYPNSSTSIQEFT
ncbi:unnamed protein product [Paramecium primaurelia]|uniref:Uncharacterized protein n=1 Tax=Paramecium primaurelia TaxID=5886 RepID=A0A8S1N8H6_PARPR|nr:unnamed protein product [Paramecium primaurelia]